MGDSHDWEPMQRMSKRLDPAAAGDGPPLAGPPGPPPPASIGNPQLGLHKPSGDADDADAAVIQVGSPLSDDGQPAGAASGGGADGVGVGVGVGLGDGDGDGPPIDEWRIASDTELEPDSDAGAPRSPRSLESQSPRRQQQQQSATTGAEGSSEGGSGSGSSSGSDSSDDEIHSRVIIGKPSFV